MLLMLFPLKNFENGWVCSQKQCFEFNGTVKEQMLGTAIGTKSAPCYAGIFWTNLKPGLLRVSKVTLLVQFRHIDYIFFYVSSKPY